MFSGHADERVRKGYTLGAAIGAKNMVSVVAQWFCSHSKHKKNRGQ
jgi:hypothetical protein